MDKKFRIPKTLNLSTDADSITISIKRKNLVEGLLFFFYSLNFVWKGPTFFFPGGVQFLVVVVLCCFLQSNFFLSGLKNNFRGPKYIYIYFFFTGSEKNIGDPVCCCIETK